MPAESEFDPVVGLRPDQLEGFRIGVTSDRRSEDLIAAFQRRGAEVMHAPTIRIAAAEDDTELTRDTAAIIAARPDFLLATTSYGIRHWFEVADAAGLGPGLTEVLADSCILVRGPKARGAVRAAGLDDSGMSAEETTASLVDDVLGRGVAGRSVAVQLHGYTDQTQLDRLRDAGAVVLSAAPYRWRVTDDTARVGRLVEAIAQRGLDAVTFTSAPAAVALLAAAEQAERHDEVVGAFRDGSVLAAAVGPVTAAPLQAVGIEPAAPDRYRMGALIRLVCEQLEEHSVVRWASPLGPVELRGRLVRLGDRSAQLAPGSLTLFRLLVSARGSVLSRAQLAAAMPDEADDHAVDVAISRLRQTLPAAGLVVTVIKRGYRLAT